MLPSPVLPPLPGLEGIPERTLLGAPSVLSSVIEDSDRPVFALSLTRPLEDGRSHDTDGLKKKGRHILLGGSAPSVLFSDIVYSDAPSLEDAPVEHG